MDIKKSIEQKVNQTVESLVNEFENETFPWCVANSFIETDYCLIYK